MFEDIKEQFGEVIAYSQTGIENPKLDSLFESWYKSKKPFIDLFGGLIWEQETPVKISLTEEEISKQIDSLIKIVEHLKNESMAEFLRQNRATLPINRVSVPYGNIPQGAKLVKALKYFETDVEILHDIQSRASQIIQGRVLEGKLCLSVHPLDFISSSENTHNWKSCHGLQDIHRAGPLSYMVDDCTVICYIKSSDGVRLPSFPDSVPWNSKRWRTLVHISQNRDIVWAGKSYPFNSEKALEVVRRRLTGLFGNNALYSTFTSNCIETFQRDEKASVKLKDRYYEIKGRLIPSHRMIKKGLGALNFNDLLDNSSYTPRVFVNTEVFSDLEENDFYIGTALVRLGGAVKCLRCDCDYIMYPETMMCNDCEMAYGDSDGENFTFCTDCDKHMLADEGEYVEGCRIVCPECARQYIPCQGCGYLFKPEDLNDRLVCIECETLLENLED